jgi:hypothetical protein
MVQRLYKYDKCLECGHEGFQWGIIIEYDTVMLDENKQYRIHKDHVFICHLCIKSIDKKLDDMESDAKNKPSAPWEADKNLTMKIGRGILH